MEIFQNSFLYDFHNLVFVLFRAFRLFLDWLVVIGVVLVIFIRRVGLCVGLAVRLTVFRTIWSTGITLKVAWFWTENCCLRDFFAAEAIKHLISKTSNNHWLGSPPEISQFFNFIVALFSSFLWTVRASVFHSHTSLMGT